MKKENDKNNVDHPSHYNNGTIECVDAIESALTPEEFRGWLKGSIIKYIWRLNHKSVPLQDCQKALWYGNKLEKNLKDG